MTSDAANQLMAKTARDLMSRHLLLVPQEMSIHGAARLLSRAQVTGAPVVDEDGRCVGVVSATDFLHLAENESFADRSHSTDPADREADDRAEEEHAPKVKDMMTPDPVVVGENTPIARIARMMLDAHIHRVMVSDEHQHPIG